MFNKSLTSWWFFIAIGTLHISVIFFRLTIDIGALVTFGIFLKRLFKTTAISSFEFSTKFLSGFSKTICITKLLAQQLEFLSSKPDGVGQNSNEVESFSVVLWIWKGKVDIGLIEFHSPQTCKSLPADL